MNRIIIIGNLGQDPEPRYSASGQMITGFSIATNHKYKTASGEQQEEVQWFSCSAFGKLAELANEYLAKGSQVYVEGRLKTHTYQGRDGQTRQSLDVAVSKIQFLGNRSNGHSNPSSEAIPSVASLDDAAALEEDDLPF